MERYFLNEHNDKCILYITKSNWKDDAPNLKNHLMKYKEIMEQRRENRIGRIEYYHLHWARDEKFFKNGAKILSVRKCIVPTFVYCESATYVMMAVNVIQTSRWNMKFLTGLLNSKLVAFWLKNKGKMQGKNYQVDKEPLLAIPLPKVVPEITEKNIINIVDQILAAKKADPKADTSALEQEIDRLVYALYGLTEEEIATIEGK
jgi:adenine-specific DNA-methyltransferase